MKERAEYLLGKAAAGELEGAEAEELGRLLAGDPERAEAATRDARFGAFAGAVLDGGRRFERSLQARLRADREPAPFVEALERRMAPRRSGALLIAAAAAGLLAILGTVVLHREPPPDPVPAAPAPPPSPVVEQHAFRIHLKDAMIFSGKPDQRFGKGRVLEAGHGLGILVRWDLSDVPPGSDVRSATLLLSSRTPGPRASGFRAFEVRRPWDEATVTWNDFAEDHPWQEPGARGQDDCAHVPLGRLQPADGRRAAVRFNDEGVALVETWIRHPDRNLGILLTGEADRVLQFASRESDGHGPELVLEYVPERSER